MYDIMATVTIILGIIIANIFLIHSDKLLLLSWLSLLLSLLS